MNNEDKILAMLEQLQQGQFATIDRLDSVDARLDSVDARLDSIEAVQDTMQADIKVLKTSVVIIENEKFREIGASLDGVLAAYDKDKVQDVRIETLETKTAHLDVRVTGLEHKAKAI